MKTTTIKCYQYEELSPEDQAKVLDNYSDINVDHSWWEFIYSDAETVGLKIDSFDCYRGEIGLSFVGSAEETARLIKENHGNTCDTYKKAGEFLAHFYAAEEIEDYNSSLERIEELETGFLEYLKSEYLHMLSAEYDYMTRAEAITETLKANEYYFNENTLKIESV